jgi:hypothetical protein
MWIKRGIVVASNYDFMSKLELLQTLKEIDEMLLPAMMGEISSVDEDVPFDLFIDELLQLSTGGVSIRYRNDDQLLIHCERQILFINYK